MGLIARSMHRLDVWQWRVRYWWLDTDAGAQWRIAALCVAVFVVIMQMIKLSIAAAFPPPAGEPAKALVWWVVQLIMLVVSAILSYALRPKPENAKPVEGNSPTVEDGQAAIEVHGPYRINDEFLLAHKVVGRVPIKSKGKK